MNVATFRRLALAIPGASESAHMNHPDFRVNGKIFATLGYPDDEWGMVKVTPDDQRGLTKSAPRVFVPCKGAWGRQGCTSVHLASVNAALLREVLAAAAQNVVAGTRKRTRVAKNSR